MPTPDASKEHFVAELKRLVSAYEKQRGHEAKDESTIRNDFLNPFWRALGWDVENLAGLPQSLREVELETRVAIGGRQKRADFVFRTDGIERFICEAKRPTDKFPAADEYQAQRYAFNLKLLICVLADFEHTNVYIVGGLPDAKEPFIAYHQWHVSDYVSRASEIWGLFARANVATGSLDQFVASLPKKSITGRPRQGWLIKPERRRTVDREFLDFFESQRERLAKALVNANLWVSNSQFSQ